MGQPEDARLRDAYDTRFPKSLSFSCCQKGGREDVFSPAWQKGTGEVSGFPQWPRGMLGLNDEDKVFVSRLMPRVGVPAQIPFCHPIEKVKIGIFLNANHLSAYLKVAIGIIWVNNAERDARITLEIPKLLAGFGLAKTDVGSVPVEPDWRVVWLSSRSNGGYLCQDRRVE